MISAFSLRAVSAVIMLASLTGFAPPAVASAPVVSLAPKSGPPGSNLRVVGAGFGSYEAVDVYFDTTDEALASTDVSGSFTATIAVGQSAMPGTHWLTGVGRRTGFSAQAPFTVRSNWTQYRGSAAHTGVDPTENVLSPSTVGHAVLKWSHDTGNRVSSSPAVVNGIVYVGSYDDRVFARRVTNGKVIWSYLTNDAVSSSPAVANGIVYVGAGDGNVYALVAATGRVAWAYWTGGYGVSSPAVVNGIVYVAALGVNPGRIYALDAATGALLWERKTSGLLWGAPAIANGLAFESSDQVLYAFRAMSGRLAWTYNVGNDIATEPTVANGIVYVGSMTREIHALDAMDGLPIWSADVSGSWSAAVDSGTVYVASNHRNGMFALDAISGAIRWTRAFPTPVSSAPTVANGVVYVGSRDLYALDATTGAILWAYNIGGYVSSAPTVVNGAIYVGSGYGQIYAFDLPSVPDRGSGPSPADLTPNMSLRPLAHPRRS